MHNDRRSSVTDFSAILLSLLLIASGAGCRLIKGVTEVPAQTVRAVTPAQKEKKIVDPVEVQQMLLRYTDEFSSRMVLGIGKLRRGTNAMPPAEVLRAKIELGTETCSIASGPNPVANLLDMTVFVIVTRMALEEHWQPKVFGESALPVLEYSRTAETNIWQLAGKVLTPDQQAEMRRGIEAWYRQNPLPESLVAVRALGFASRVAAASKTNPSFTDSVFGLLSMDPLAGMEPAVREIAQTRMFAERAMFVTQKMPTLLRWQMELLSLNAVSLPAVQQLVTNSTQITASIERFAAVAEKLPGQLSTEREQILKALESQEKQMTPLVHEARQTLTAGTQMSASLNTTLTTFDALMKRFGVGETNNVTAADTNAAPFRILDYGQTAGQLEKMARQLTELLRAVDEATGSNNLSRISTQLTPVVQQAKSGGKEVVDHAFWRGILLVVIVCFSALFYRFLSARINAGTRSKPNSQ